MTNSQLEKYFDSVAGCWDRWKARKTRYYNQLLIREYAATIPAGSSVLEIGCATGDLLHSVKPRFAVGVDISENMLSIARKKYPQYIFIRQNAQKLSIDEKFDYIIISDLIGYLEDIYGAFINLKKIVHANTTIIINSYNFLWEFILKTGESFGLRMHQGYQNWLSLKDIENLLYLAGFRVRQKKRLMLLPIKIPLFSELINLRFTKVPLLRKLNLVNFITALPEIDTVTANDYNCSIVIACRNEVGNVEETLERIPQLGKHTEVIFIDGASSDGTVEVIERLIEKYRGIKDIKLIHQIPRNSLSQGSNSQVARNQMLKLGKADALRKGFAFAAGEILIISDADLTIAPEEIAKFYKVLAGRKAQFVNGSRLIYRPREGAMNGMRFLGNRLFSKIFSYLLNKNLSDTLCANKAFFKKDYVRMKELFPLFGDFDPFGDFELLFTAAAAGLQIVDMPVRYQPRIAGHSKVNISKHGWLLLKMCFIGFLKFKMPFFRKFQLYDKADCKFS